MIVEIKVPTPGESIAEVEISRWNVSDGDLVSKDQELAEIESDKATLSLVAAESGKIKILLKEEQTVVVGSVACTIDTSFASLAESHVDSDVEQEPVSEIKEKAKEVKPTQTAVLENNGVKVSPLAHNVMEEAGLHVEDIINGLKRISVADVERVKTLASVSSTQNAPLSSFTNASVVRDVERQKMTTLRKKLAQRLVTVKNETAMLTTFNEVDMSAVMTLRKKYQTDFVSKHGVKLGFMSFFIKAASLALKHHPMINAWIDNEDIVIPSYHDVSVAVQTPKGLMVPVIRNVETLGLADIENSLKALAEKARIGKISLEEMTGGTFTVTNGGVFGSMLSTPIINPPQSAILGMHNIVERPVAINGQVEVRPVMYLALSYDHRIIDGKDSVGFLVKIKEMLENPAKFLLGGNDPEKMMLDL